MRTARSAALAVALCMTASRIAMAQPAAPPPQGGANVASASGAELGEIIVTAQRRSENLQSVPIAVTALTAERMEASAVLTTAGLGSITPAVTWSNVAGAPEPRIRGIGNSTAGIGVENSVAIYVDGVYIGAPKGSILSLNDVERVEVLKGPQGTLFGRNATAGVIQVVTKDPSSEFSGRADFGVSNYETVDADLYLTGPVAKNLAADLSLRLSHQGRGYGRNVFNGGDTYRTDRDVSARSKWLLEMGEATTVRAAVDFSQVSSSDPSNPWMPGTVTPATGVVSQLGRYDVESNVSPLHKARSVGGSVKIDQKISDLTLTSITAYRTTRFDQLVDADGSPLPVTVQRYTERDTPFSEELQLSGDYAGRLQWVVGAYYLYLTGKYDPYGFVSGAPGAASLTNSYVKSVTKSLAGFGQATYELMPGTKLTAGFRYTEDKRSIDGSQVATTAAGVSTTKPLTPANITWRTPTWRLSLDHKFDNGMLVYVSYDRGYKSGGYNGQSASLAPKAQVPYAPEHIDDYELGLKSEFLDHRLRINSAAFYYKYSNIQVNTYLVPGNIPVIYNGAESEIYGLDTDIDFRATDALTFTGGLVLLHDRFTSFPLAPIGHLTNGKFSTTIGPAVGNRLPFAPDATANLGFDYRFDLSGGTAHLAVNELYSTGFYTQVDNLIHQPSYNMLGASLTWKPQDERFSIMFWANNLLKAHVLELGSISGSGALVSYQAPRTFGVRVGAKF